MDINEMRSLITVIGLLCFLAIVFWAFSRKRGQDFSEAANLPFNEPEEVAEKARADLLRKW